MYKINPNYLLFNDGEKRTIQEENEIYCKHIGEIELSSGQIIACDPFNLFSLFNEKPFLKSVTPGTYPVLLNIIRYKQDGDERVAYAMIRFSNKKCVKWELALIKGQDVAKLKDNEFFGYGVDSGTGCFMDKESMDFLIAYEKEQLKINPDYYLYEEVQEQFDKEYKHTRSWLVTSFKEKASIAMFSSGFGDGAYPSFWGLDENGDIVCLVTDFLLTE